MITRDQVECNQNYMELMGILRHQGASPKLVGGLARRGYTNHDIDISVSKTSVKVPFALLLLKFGRRFYPVSIELVRLTDLKEVVNGGESETFSFFERL